MKANRKKEILEIVDKLEIVSYKELAKMLNVSTMTIRRDVDNLANDNLLLKEHGGVRKIALKVKTTNEKMELFPEEKNYIAQRAVELIQPHSVIYLGAGTTILALAKHLKNDHKHIITNSLFTFCWLIEHHFENVLLTGGEFIAKTEEFHGIHAERLVQDFSIDYAFIATNGIIDENLTTFSPFCGRLQLKIMEQAREIYLLADHSKFGISDSYIFGKIHQLDGIISDDGLPNDIKEHYQQYTKVIN
ncbi:DeoR/GlpR family DNA-binding transcription regulator [Streptococcus ovis]|uniref:DeoR/GlpR family DNA-binding transcription regulator n=1 Tax=Streptococcus ovis TaxID=82806 RepID=UPI000370A44B|nr:DeoR/GlpR family DNA-binding transcription regulator [Streptococcus ovis]